MKPALLLATLSLTICVPAHGYETSTGAVMICDTQNQVERYVQLFDGDPQAAIRAANTGENDPNACALVDVSYVEGPDVGRWRMFCSKQQLMSAEGERARPPGRDWPRRRRNWPSRNNPASMP